MDGWQIAERQERAKADVVEEAQVSAPPHACRIIGT